MLSDLTIFSEFLYTGMTEVLAQQLEVFNEATNGCVVLKTQKHVGDYSDRLSFGKIPGGLVRRRNAYGSGALTAKHLAHLDETMVKVAAGTPPIELNPSQWKWIQRDEAEAGAAMGLQLARDTLADMVNTAVGVVAVALTQVASHVNDISAKTGNVGTQNPYPANRVSPATLNDTVSLMGDAGGRISCWLMHSGPLYQLFGNALTNDNRLFNYGNVNVVQDGFGRRYVMSDIPALKTVTGTGPYVTKYTTLGLAPGAVTVDLQDDMIDNWDSRNGNENISKTYQAEWSYSVGVSGFAWDKTNGGKSPTDAALMTSANWDRYVTDDKNLPGVVLVSAKDGLA